MTVSINKLKKSIDAIINPKYKVNVMKETEKRFDYINPNDIPLIIVSPLKTKDNIVQYVIIKFAYHNIQCCTTRGETLDCELFRSLCNLKNAEKKIQCVTFETDMQTKRFRIPSLSCGFFIQ